MHGYSAGDTRREQVVFFMALVSIAIVPLVNSLFEWLTRLVPWTYEIKYTITSLLVFSAIYFLFNKWVWRLFGRLLKIPDLNGNWLCKGHSFSYGGSEERDWISEIQITQEWSRIAVTQRTKDSDSFSTSIIGGLVVEGNGETLLSYVYMNTPRNSTPGLLRHEGLAKVRFSSDLATARGDYFNDKDRKTYGTMELTKKK